MFFQLLQENKQVDILKRNFIPRGGATTACLSTTTVEIKKEDLEVTQKIKYQPYSGAVETSTYQKYLVDKNNKTMTTRSDTCT